MKKGNVMIMAGGTGGHVIPALSVAKELKAKGYQVHWLGSIKGIENDLVPDAGYELHRISVTGLRGSGLLKTLLAPLQIMRALWQAFKVFRQVKPVMALGMGGFASGPGGFLAYLLRVPLVIHEQNAIPGMTNKILSAMAKTLLQAFEGTFAKAKSVRSVGNPVRKNIVEIQPPQQRLMNRSGPLNVLVVGGSLGAVAINNILIEMMASQPSHINVWHQVGKRNYADVKQGYQNAGVDQVKVSAFIGDMAQAYEWADVVICRSGALTVSEMMAAGVASILIPYPFAVDDHQTANGQFLVSAGAARLNPQRELTAQGLLNELNDLHQNRESIIKMSVAARTLAKPDSASVVAKYCIEAINV
ncbi:undecaprenyldiphospho-muramoylpentapeptide beta-N-acetylglucosaminyltransferase [Oceaniserpentilla sp. 4NH20-0058]|uniref:undecaprenyldiphospho-muramoylpentapeptide beta-N-acetylglucosaminyltransferase n=1 Tax=Oceaniserpentilla sp. 4NH20-0058 TaxID=3127660 RepID=UPI003103341C